MILMLGPAGSGKSLQGQILAIRHDWQWISAGQVLREKAKSDPEAQATLDKGELIKVETTNRLIAEHLDEQSDLGRVVLDGYPRTLDQATALVDYVRQRRDGDIDMVINLDVGREELTRRLLKRGRADDTDGAIQRRFDIYAKAGEEVLGYLIEQGCRVERVFGGRTVGQVHDNIQNLLDTLN